MTTSRALSSVLHNFLGTYTSRNSEFDGYWLFGFLLNDTMPVQFDLMQTPGLWDSPAELAHVLAAEKFSTQLRKAGIDRSRVAGAQLEISKIKVAAIRLGNNSVRHGYDVRFRAYAVTNTYRVFDHSREVFVAPHDATIEYQSTRPRFSG